MTGGANMKVLVTGGAGFIGSAMVRLLIARGYDVVNVDALTYAADLANLTEIDKHPRYFFEHCDIRDQAGLDRVFETYKPKAIIHLAAETHVDRSISRPEKFVDTNVNGTLTLLECARRYWDNNGNAESFRFLHVSTDEVYGSVLLPGQFSEDSRYNPSSPYSASKAASDHLVQAWGKTYGLPVMLTHCTNNFGPRQTPDKLIPMAITQGLLNKPITIYGNGSNVRDWLYVEDHAEALLEVLSKGRIGQSYNIGGGQEFSNLSVAHKICARLDDLRPEAAPHNRLLSFVQDRPGHDQRYSVSTTRIQSELNWYPAITFDERLTDTVRWYWQHQSRWRKSNTDGTPIKSRMGRVA